MLSCNLSTRLNENSVEREEERRERGGKEEGKRRERGGKRGGKEEGNEREVVVGKGRRIEVRNDARTMTSSVKDLSHTLHRDTLKKSKKQHQKKKKRKKKVWRKSTFSPLSSSIII